MYMNTSFVVVALSAINIALYVRLNRQFKIAELLIQKILMNVMNDGCSTE